MSERTPASICGLREILGQWCHHLSNPSHHETSWGAPPRDTELFIRSACTYPLWHKYLFLVALYLLFPLYLFSFHFFSCPIFTMYAPSATPCPAQLHSHVPLLHPSSEFAFLCLLLPLISFYDPIWPVASISLHPHPLWRLSLPAMSVLSHSHRSFCNRQRATAQHSPAHCVRRPGSLHRREPSRGKAPRRVLY